MDVLRRFISIVFNPKFIGILSFVYGTLSLVRDEFLPLDLAERLRLGGLFRVIDWYWWVLFGIIIWTISVAWESAKYRDKNKADTSETQTVDKNIEIAKETDKAPFKDQEELTDIRIEAPFSLSRQGVYRFTVRNKGKRKIINCRAKIEVAEIHRNENGIMLNLHPSNYMYPNNVLWGTKSSGGSIELSPNDPNYLDVLELGQERFRFLFDGDQPLPKGTSEPKNIGNNDVVWLSHRHHLLVITLFGEYSDGKPVEFVSEFILNFMVSGMQNIKFPSNAPPHADEGVPEKLCIMSIKKVTSKENMDRYLN